MNTNNEQQPYRPMTPEDCEFMARIYDSRALDPTLSDNIARQYRAEAERYRQQAAKLRAEAGQ